MTFSPDKFRNHIAKHGDLAKTSKFDVRIFKGNLEQNNTAVRGADTKITEGLSFQCEGAELPGYNINTLEFKGYGPSWHVATVPAYSEINLTFLCATDMWEKAFFEDWMQQIIPTRYTNSPNVEYRDSYISQILIMQYSEADSKNPTYKCVIDEAFPTTIAPLTLSWGDIDGVHRLQVTFRYSRWARFSNILSPAPTNTQQENKKLDGKQNNNETNGKLQIKPLPAAASAPQSAPPNSSVPVKGKGGRFGGGGASGGWSPYDFFSKIF